MSTWLNALSTTSLRLRAWRTPSVTRLAVRALETHDELMHSRVAGHHPCLCGGTWTWRGQPFPQIDRCERQDSPRSLPGAIGQRARETGGWATAAPCTGSAPTEPREFVLRGPRERIAIGFARLEHVPGQRRELAGSGHHGEVAIFAAQEFAHEGAKWAGVPIQMLGGLDQEPADMAGPLFRDPARITAVGRLMDRGYQSQIGGQPSGGRKPTQLADGGEERCGHRDIDAGEREQESDAGIGRRVCHLGLIQGGEFLLDRGE